MKYRIKYKASNGSYFIQKKGWILWNTHGRFTPNFHINYYDTLKEAKANLKKICEQAKLEKTMDKVVHEMGCV